MVETGKSWTAQASDCNWRSEGKWGARWIFVCMFSCVWGGGGVEIFFGGGGASPRADPKEPRLHAGAPPPISLLNLQFRAPRRVPPPPFPRPLPSPEKRVGVKSQGSWLCVCGSVVAAAAAAAGKEQERVQAAAARRRRQWLDMNAASAPAVHGEPLLARGR